MSDVWDKEAPDIWWRNGDGTRMEYRHVGNGEWRWRCVKDDGAVLSEGEGSP